MKKLFVLLTVIISGCGVQNMFRTSADDCRDYMAEELIWTIDEAIKDEIAHNPPSGFKTKLYDPNQWSKYWNDRIYYIYDIGPDDCGGQYNGPTGSEFISYIIRERRNNGLSEIPLEPRNVGKVH